MASINGIIVKLRLKWRAGKKTRANGDVENVLVDCSNFSFTFRFRSHLHSFSDYVYVHFSDFVFGLGSQYVVPYQLPLPQCTGAPIRLLQYTQPATAYVSSVVDGRCRDDSENINVACAMEL